MTPRLLIVGLMLVSCCAGSAQEPLMKQREWTAIREQASGSAPYENLRALTRLHRIPGTVEFDQAADYVLARAKEYGLHDAHEERFPIDGKLHYGLMRSHLAWTVEGASLWEVKPETTLLADWATNPIRLADYSHTADIEAPLVDVGAGQSDSDYAGKDIRGKIVLADGVLTRVQHLAITKYGAAGIVSDMPNQTTAWSGLDQSLIRWGHLDASSPQGFAFHGVGSDGGGLARGACQDIAGNAAGSRQGGGWSWPLDSSDRDHFRIGSSGRRGGVLVSSRSPAAGSE